MGDIDIRIVSEAGRITLNRPDALNALTYEMVLQIHEILDVWRNDPAVSLVVIDAVGERAFCSGGDIAEMYATGTGGDYDYGRRFWADEYRLNAAIAEYEKPIVTFLQGFTMGGGVGVGCHGSHRIVGETSQVAMPECGIGLVPDVGGSMLLARGPGFCGEYLGLTGTRMGPGDAIYVGFADSYFSETRWPEVIGELEKTGDLAALDAASEPAPEAGLAAIQEQIDAIFEADTLIEIVERLQENGSDWAQRGAKALLRNSPIAVACALQIIRRVRGTSGIRPALEQEYRYTWRAAEDADFIEGIRAQIIDRDRNPRWKHQSIAAVPKAEVEAMLSPIPGQIWPKSPNS